MTMEVKHHLLNPDGSYSPIIPDEPIGGTAAQYASFIQAENEREAEARALMMAGKVVLGVIAERMAAPNGRAQHEAEPLGMRIAEDLAVVFAATMTKTGSVSHQTVDQIKTIEAPVHVVNGDAPHMVDKEALARSLPGVESVAGEDGSMLVRFSDGTEATVTRSFLAWTGDPTFELWLPRDERTGMAKMMPKLSRGEVLNQLGQLAAAAAKRAA
ncbi:hypothetical protein SGO26_30345 (plasmid) [Cupriavidus metallidurans]|uniref:hypothetical protein n=1 Tax=Cupriavidus metallidurans TaxID=119219 RepID=UPI003D70E007